jgi:hypothetical protein
VKLCAPAPRQVLTRPPYAAWAGLAVASARAAASWRFAVGGVPAGALRRVARSEALALAVEFSSRLGVPVARPTREPDLLLLSGHQPDLFHPGVWVKSFLLQRLAEDTGGTAIHLVVDTDAFEAVALEAPVPGTTPHRARQVLAHGGQTHCFACAPVPDAAQIRSWREASLALLAGLPAPAVRERFERFAALLEGARGEARNLAELLTFARRRYEAEEGGTYLELPVSESSRTHAFRVFLTDVSFRAEEFWAAYNAELAAYRRRHRTRSAAQPLPDLARDGDLLEIPFWHLTAQGRSTLWVRPGRRPELFAGGVLLARLPADPGDAASSLTGHGAHFAPKALALTLFHRLLVGDLFLHGLGGARYDEVTDGLLTAFYGVPAPPFVVASMTLALPLSVPTASDEEIEQAERRLARLRHNPDEFLDAIEEADEARREQALALAAHKRRLQHDLEAPGSHRKTLGLEIRAVNERLAELLAPVAAGLGEELGRLRTRREAAAVLGDRTYPFCLFDPKEIREMASAAR